MWRHEPLEPLPWVRRPCTCPLSSSRLWHACFARRYCMHAHTPPGVCRCPPAPHQLPPHLLGGTYSPLHLTILFHTSWGLLQPPAPHQLPPHLLGFAAAHMHLISSPQTSWGVRTPPCTSPSPSTPPGVCCCPTAPHQPSPHLQGGTYSLLVPLD